MNDRRQDLNLTNDGWDDESDSFPWPELAAAELNVQEDSSNNADNVSPHVPDASVAKLPWDEARRKRNVRKTVRFTKAEWDVISRNIELTGLHTFGEYARTMLMNGQIISVPRVRQLDPISAIVAPLANNLNQIARLANTTQTVTAPQLVSAEVMLKKIHALLEIEFAPDNGGA